MTIAAKPPSYTVNTGATHCPNHLWMMDEASGTTLTDRGSTGGYNLTLSDTAAGSGPEWASDGTHGPVLQFVAANGDRANYSSVSGLSGTQTLGLIVKGTAGTGARTIVSLTDPSVLNKYVSMVYQGDEDLEVLSRWTTLETANTSTDLTTAWDFVALRFSDTSVDWSLNGSAFTTLAVTATGRAAGITRVSLGALDYSTPANFWDDQMCASMWWHGSKSDAEIASIAADPWQFLDTSTIQAFQYQSRLNPLLRM